MEKYYIFYKSDFNTERKTVVVYGDHLYSRAIYNNNYIKNFYIKKETFERLKSLTPDFEKKFIVLTEKELDNYLLMKDII